MAAFFCPRAPTIRSTPSLSRTLSAPFSTTATFSTAGVRPLKQLSQHVQTSHPRIVCRTSPIFAGPRVPTATTRQASSSSAASPNPSPIPSQNSGQDVLTWDKFFDLRRKRRHINLAASIVTAAGAVFVMVPIIAQQDVDSWGAQISGLDPMIVLGISTFAVAAGGWLCGPSFGSAAFGMWAARRGWAKAIVEKEKNFYRRIKNNRADPSASSPQNPIPDYYGEKIASVKDYRRWLKDQRAFNRKKNKDLI